MGKRVSLILKDADEAEIAPYLREGSASFEALRVFARKRGDGDIRSEAAALRALLQAGAEALREAVLDVGYAELAAELNTPEFKAAEPEFREARRRYARRTDAHL